MKKRYRHNCKMYKAGDDKCRYLCPERSEPEPVCYEPLVVHDEEWHRMDKVLREFAKRQRR